MTISSYKIMLNELIELTVPLLVSAVLMSIVMILNIKILSEANSSNLYILGMYLPVQYFVISIIESFRSAAFGCSTIMTNENNISEQIFTLGLFCVAVLLTCLGLFILLGVKINFSKDFMRFTAEMLLASTFYASFSVCN